MVDIAILQEVKPSDPKYTVRKCPSYEIWTAAAGTANCRGVAPLVRENADGAFTIENEKVIKSNVILCEMETGRHKWWFVIGCYLPP